MEISELATLKAQIGEINRNMADVKTNIATFLTSIGNMHKEFTPRDEQIKQDALIGKQIDELETAIKKNATDIETLKEKWWTRPTWGVTMTFTTGGALIVGLITFVLSSRLHG
jgi:seryl-tRNA synthetase